INRFLSKENGWDRSSRATSTITPCRPTVRRLLRSASWSPNSGNDRSGGAVRTMVRLGSGSRGWPKTGSPNRSSFIHGRKYASPSRTQGGSRMRESRLYGSVRGALSNERPYRDRCARNDGREGCANRRHRHDALQQDFSRLPNNRDGRSIRPPTQSRAELQLRRRRWDKTSEVPAVHGALHWWAL